MGGGLLLPSVCSFNQILGTQFCMEVAVNMPMHFQLMEAVTTHILGRNFTTKGEMPNALMLMKFSEFNPI